MGKYLRSRGLDLPFGFTIDHFPGVKNPYRPIQVPYLGGEDYDNRGFGDFPGRRGWTSERLEKAHVDASTRRDAGSFLQTWLYFGMLSEVLGVPIKRSDFIREDDNGQLWITTTQLPNYIRDWEDRIASSSLPDEENRYIKSSECLVAVARIVTDLSNHQIVPSSSKILGPEHELSIAILMFTIDRSMKRVCRRSHQHALLEYYLPSDGPFIQLVKSRMLEAGSCPSLVDRLDKRLHYTGLYYASLLGPPSIQEDHRRCTRNECRVEDLDKYTYPTAHVQPGCNCKHVGIDFRELLAIVFWKFIPLISIEDHPNGLRLNLVPFLNEPDTSYVAISHVWSHGLGNAHNNSLPECQLRVLHQRTVEANPQGPGYFWIDTLCVPREPPEARKCAISKMKDIYHLAELVLVLDAELIRSTKECSLEEILMRITCSRWLTRLWTFQEAVLARRLVFQFLEGPIDMFSLKHDVQFKLQRHADEENDILLQGIDFWASIRQIAMRQPSQARKLALLCRDAGWRSTSWAEDESICFATLLNLDLEKLLAASGSDRMRLFWSLQKEIPSAILFEPGQRLEDDGFRWAHSSLLNIRMDEGRWLSITDDVARVGAQGLTVSCFGFFLSLSRNPVNALVRFKHRNEQTWYIMVKSYDMDPDDWKNICIHSLKSPVLILRDRVGDIKETDGFLASYQRQESETIFVQYICRVMVMKEGSYLESSAVYSEREAHDKQLEAVGEPTSSNQQWCIS